MSLTPKSVRDGWHKDQRIEQQNTREVTKEHVHNWSLKKFTLSTGLTITGTDLEAVYPLWWKMEISYLSRSSHLKEKLMKINVTSHMGMNYNKISHFHTIPQISATAPRVHYNLWWFQYEVCATDWCWKWLVFSWWYCFARLRKLCGWI